MMHSLLPRVRLQLNGYCSLGYGQAGSDLSELGEPFLIYTRNETLWPHEGRGEILSRRNTAHVEGSVGTRRDHASEPDGLNFVWDQKDRGPIAIRDGSVNAAGCNLVYNLKGRAGEQIDRLAQDFLASEQDGNGIKPWTRLRQDQVLSRSDRRKIR